MKVQIRFSQEELTLAVTKYMESEGYTVKAVRFLYDPTCDQRDSNMAISCEADVERGFTPGLVFPHSHIPNARAYTPDGNK